MNNNPLRDSLNEVMNTYLQEKENDSDHTGHRLSRLNIVRDAIYQHMGTDFKKIYTVEGSIGQFNNWAWIPWLKTALKNRNVHVNTQQGYYLVFLFDEKMENVYLSLNQGWSFFNEKYKKNNKLANKKVQGVSKKIRNMLSNNIKDNTVTRIDLQATGRYGRGYESSHIIGKRYQKGNIPGDKVLIEDLEEMLGLYNDLAAFMRNRTFEELNNELLLGNEEFIEENKEDNYQEASNEQEVENAATDHKPHAQTKKPTLKTVDSKSYYPRDVKQAAIALTLADHTCEYDESLPTFISKSSGKTYVEAHHLIPVKYYEDFEYSIDVPENIVALNPMTHRQIHHGNDEDKLSIIETLLNKRSEKLKEVGLEVTLSELKRMYGII